MSFQYLSLGCLLVHVVLLKRNKHHNIIVTVYVPRVIAYTFDACVSDITATVFTVVAVFIAETSSWIASAESMLTAERVPCCYAASCEKGK